MIIMSFELTMPNRGSWNGQWSGEDRKYYVIKKYAQRYVNQNPYLYKIVSENGGSFYYGWSDGWGASINIEIIDGTLAAKRRKISAGFCGYEWMIDSIVSRGCIKASHELVS